MMLLLLCRFQHFALIRTSSQFWLAKGLSVLKGSMPCLAKSWKPGLAKAWSHVSIRRLAWLMSRFHRALRYRRSKPK